MQAWLGSTPIEDAFRPKPKSKPAPALPSPPITPPTATKDPYALIGEIEDLLGKDLKQLDILNTDLAFLKTNRPPDFKRIKTFCENRIGTICERLDMTEEELRDNLSPYSRKLLRLLNALERLG
jgi:hypothetical protein